MKIAREVNAADSLACFSATNILRDHMRLRVKTDLECSCVETVTWLANGSTENLPKEQSTRMTLGRFKGSCTHGGKEVQPHRSLTSTNFVKHIYREHNQEADRWATLELREEEKLRSIGKTPPTTWKAIQGFWDGSFKDDGKSGCGIVIKGVDREKWVTISKIAVPLNVGAAMAAEVIGVCVLTSVLDLILCKSLSVHDISQRVGGVLPW